MTKHYRQAGKKCNGIKSTCEYVAAKSQGNTWRYPPFQSRLGTIGTLCFSNTKHRLWCSHQAGRTHQACLSSHFAFMLNVLQLLPQCPGVCKRCRTMGLVQVPAQPESAFNNIFEWFMCILKFMKHGLYYKNQIEVFK